MAKKEKRYKVWVSLPIDIYVNALSEEEAGERAVEYVDRAIDWRERTSEELERLFPLHEDRTWLDFPGDTVARLSNEPTSAVSVREVGEDEPTDDPARPHGTGPAVRAGHLSSRPNH